MRFHLPDIKDAYFLKAVIVSNFKRLALPFKLSYAVTYRCNLRCSMCNIWKKTSTDRELTLGEIEHFFRKANRFSWVGITGGEPFLRPDLPEIVDIVVKFCCFLDVIHFATNAQLKDNIMGIVEHINNKKNKTKMVFTISIDGPPDLHDKIRGKEGAWEKAIQTFNCLRKIKSVKAQIGFTLSPQNIGSFEDTFIALKDVYPLLKFDDLTVNIFQKSDLYYENQGMTDLDPNEAREEIIKIQRIDRDRFSINNFLRRKYLKLYIKYLETKKCPLKCQALSSTCFLDPYGNLLPCVVYNKKLINIRGMNEDLSFFWNSNYAKRLSHECSYNLCPGCWSPCDAYSAIAASLMKNFALR